MNKFLLGLLLLPATAIARQDSTEQSASSKMTVEGKPAIVVYKQPDIWAQSTNFSNALSVQQTGIQTFSSGAPGSDVEMIIRGNGDPYGNSKPLIMIDGMPFYGDYSAINTYTIESINVEKIPASFSAPLSLAQNGVIHIRTAKSGTHPSKWYVNLNANIGFSSRATPQYDIITDPGQYYETYWQGLRRSIVGGPTPEQAASQNLIPALYGHNLYNVPDAELIDPATGKLNPNARLKYKDSWNDALTRLGAVRQYNVSARKTWKKADLFISGNYAKDDGYMIGSSFERMGTNLQAHYRPVKGLEIGISGFYSYSKDQQLPYGTTYINPVFALYNTAPVHPVYQRDAAGNILTDPATGEKQYSDYPYNVQIIPLLERFKNTQRYKNLFLIPSIKYEIVPGLNVAIQASYMKRTKLYTAATEDTCVLTGNFIFQPEINYHTHWNKHQLSAKVQYFSMNASLDMRNELIDRYRISELLQDNYQMVLGDVAYDFNHKLKVQANLQKHLGINTHQYIPADNWNWATLASWEQKVGTLSTEFFAGYSSSVIQYSLFTPMTTNGYYSAVSNGADPRQKQIDLGVKISGNRVEANMNWFQKNANDLYLSNDFPSTVGGNYLSQGLNTRTRGLEVNINARLTNPKARVYWSMGLYATHWNTRITAVPGNDTIYTYHSLIAKGANPNEWYAPEYAGVDPRTGTALYYKYTNGQQVTTNDINSLMKSDYRSQGINAPTVFGSVYNYIKYKHFSLQFAISYAIGGTAYDTYYSSLMGGTGNYHKDLLEAWTPENRSSSIPALQLWNGNNVAYSSRFTTSASWASLKYVSLNYRLPFRLYRKSAFDNMTVYATGENLFFLSARKGFNPSEAPGTEMYSYQPMRTLRLGVNISF